MILGITCIYFAMGYACLTVVAISCRLSYVGMQIVSAQRNTVMNRRKGEFKLNILGCKI